MSIHKIIYNLVDTCVTIVTIYTTDIEIWKNYINATFKLQKEKL